MRVAFALLILVAAASATEIFVNDAIFESFVDAHGKKYESAEEMEYRRKVFNENLQKIADLNASNSLDDAEYGITRFADMTEEEFQREVLVQMPSEAFEHRREMPKAELLDTDDLPASLDWREKGAVTEVRDQQSCGSCWAFSAVQDVESKWFLSKGDLTKLSVQQVIECDPHDAACYGGFPSKAFQYIKEVGGVEAEASYPYVVENKVICLANQTFNYTMCDWDGSGDPCTFYCDTTCRDKVTPHATIKSFEAVSDDEDQIAAYLTQHGPISIAMNANNLQFYRKGISNPWLCNPTRINHALLLVGFGTENGKDYWLVKNSWGEKWGEDGYFRLIRGKGKCGVNSMVASSIV